MGTTVITWQLVEALYRQWAVDLGPQGVRAAWTRIGGTIDAVVGGPDYGSSYAGNAENDEVLAAPEAETLLRRLPSALEIADTAAFLASARAGSMTSTAVNLTAGAVCD